MVEVIWTALALEDLQSIHDYISKDSPYYAGRFVDKLIAKTDILVKYPKAGKIVPEFENDSIRELLEGNYRIIYRINSKNKIGIVRVHHAARLLK